MKNAMTKTNPTGHPTVHNGRIIHIDGDVTIMPGPSVKILGTDGEEIKTVRLFSMLPPNSQARIEKLMDEVSSEELIYQSKRGNSKKVEQLLAAGADVNSYEGRDGPIALPTAAAAGHMKTVKVLLAAGPTKTIRDRALSEAVDQARTRTLRLLLAAGVSDEAKNYALFRAHAEGSKEMVKILLRAGATIGKVSIAQLGQTEATATLKAFYDAKPLYVRRKSNRGPQPST